MELERELPSMALAGWTVAPEGVRSVRVSISVAWSSCSGGARVTIQTPTPQWSKCDINVHMPPFCEVSRWPAYKAIGRVEGRSEMRTGACTLTRGGAAAALPPGRTAPQRAQLSSSQNSSASHQPVHTHLTQLPPAHTHLIQLPPAHTHLTQLPPAHTHLTQCAR
ncbi:hypothetical protein HJG60_009466 [Phyllostomus discolor]|uniref:Uncharacterized protein n=1 Tax=Phyllostomus discolor TaxID=89673 RepID=A0A833YJT0_9CHIR|nr:hypothetical protein HJG60_009466 [Phyllostomus discolor]